MKEKQINIRATEADIQLIKALAESQHRTMSNYILWLVKQEAAKQREAA